MHIDMAPDIYLFLVCAMSPNINYEDVLVSFLRSSIIIFPAPRHFRQFLYPAVAYNAHENRKRCITELKITEVIAIELYFWCRV